MYDGRFTECARPRLGADPPPGWTVTDPLPQAMPQWDEIVADPSGKKYLFNSAFSRLGPPWAESLAQWQDAVSSMYQHFYGRVPSRDELWGGMQKLAQGMDPGLLAKQLQTTTEAQNYIAQHPVTAPAPTAAAPVMAAPSSGFDLSSITSMFSGLPSWALWGGAAVLGFMLLGGSRR